MISTPLRSFTFDWFTGREFDLMIWLKPFIGQPIHALEIGCFEGRSTLFFLDNILTHPKATITCIDTFKGGSEHNGIDFSGVWNRFYSNIISYGPKVTVSVGNSADVLPTLPKDHFSFIYIDGSHKADDVYRDAKFAWPLLTKGGRMIFDDYLWDGHAGTKDETKLGIDHFFMEVNAIPVPSYMQALEKP